MPKPLARRAARGLFSEDVAAAKNPDADTRVWGTDDWYAVSRESDGVVTIACQPSEGRSSAAAAKATAYAVFRAMHGDMVPFVRWEVGAMRERGQSTAYTIEFRTGVYYLAAEHWAQFDDGSLPEVEER
jgi:hypothetical protein